MTANNYAFVSRNELWLSVNKKARLHTFGEFINASIGALKLLQPIHSCFRQGLYLLGDSAKTSVPLAIDGANVEAHVTKYGWDREAPWKPSGLSPQGEVTRESIASLEFRFTVSSTKRPREGQLRLEFSCSGTRSSIQNVCMSIDFPVTGEPAFYESEFVHELITALAEYWHPQFIDVTTGAFAKATRSPVKEYRHHRPLGWMNYIARPGVCDVVPADVQCEPFGSDGGALITLQRDPISADDPEAVARAISVRDALLPGGWLSFDQSPAARPASEPVAG